MRWLRKNVFYLSATLGVCCFLEAFIHWTEGTNPNVVFPWGHYELTLVALGVLLLSIAWCVRLPRPDFGPPPEPEGLRMPRRRRHRRR